MTVNRRAFLAATAAMLATVRGLSANALGLPLAIQLYSVREQMAQDFDGTLAAVAAAGFLEVESASLPKLPAAQIRASLDKAGLRCVSSHHGYADLQGSVEERCAYDAALGSKYIICASPGHRDPAAKGPLTLDDWRFNADTFNQWSAVAARNGLMLGYHNHIHEFDPLEGIVPYDELLRLCDPGKVTFELDCGWAKVAGRDPVELMKAHPHRFSMLHVKDFQLVAAGGSPTVTELGRGSVDYRPVLAQARQSQHIRHAFVEQEGFTMPWQAALKTDAAYMRGLS